MSCQNLPWRRVRSDRSVAWGTALWYSRSARPTTRTLSAYSSQTQAGIKAKINITEHPGQFHSDKQYGYTHTHTHTASTENTHLNTFSLLVPRYSPSIFLMALQTLAISEYWTNAYWGIPFTLLISISWNQSRQIHALKKTATIIRSN